MPISSLRPAARLRRSPAPPTAPVPPNPLPPASVVTVPGVGELFVRDSGGDGTPVLLLHGWMFPADLNWFRTYDTLTEAGYRVLALDHRGHGRGLRSPEPFRLSDCAADAAALVRHLGCGPVVAVGYSMGGPIAMLMARDHPDVVSATVQCATAQDWQDAWQKVFWRGMALLRLALSVAPHATWRRSLLAGGFPDNATTSWFVSELVRGNGRDLAEAGRELSRYDSKGWIGSLTLPCVVILTRRDTSVPPRKQRELAAALRADLLEIDGDHYAVTAMGRRFASLLAEAVGRVSEPAPRRVAAV